MADIVWEWDKCDDFDNDGDYYTEEEIAELEKEEYKYDA